MRSERLPGKVLKPVLGRPLLTFLIERLRRLKLADAIVVATTKNPADDPIEALCKEEGVSFFRGSEGNVLERYFQTAQEYYASVIVRITADCPLVDPEVVDKVIQFYLDHATEYDYVSNVLERTYPRGMDTEVFSYKALERAASQAKEQEEREHVTLYLYKHPETFRLGSVKKEEDLSSYRWVLDTPEDLQLLTKIFEELYPANPEFGMDAILKLMEEHPDWRNINAHVKQKRV